ncbi:glycosyltransferase, partial [Amnibacterium sp.]|uniref:glycosyltransferase n=1 Tax=Amnibacterium sp. TaxID=1872496 RepID=UPI0026075800
TGTVVAGYVTDEELADLYAAGIGLILVSLAEGFGLPIVEAAAAGVARFVLSDLPVFRWIARDAAEYVDPTSVAAIGEALRRMLEEPADAPALGVTRFDWDDSAEAVRLAAVALTRA